MFLLLPALPLQIAIKIPFPIQPSLCHRIAEGPPFVGNKKTFSYPTSINEAHCDVDIPVVRSSLDLTGKVHVSQYSIRRKHTYFACKCRKILRTNLPVRLGHGESRARPSGRVLY